MAFQSNSLQDSLTGSLICSAMSTSFPGFTFCACATHCTKSQGGQDLHFRTDDLWSSSLLIYLGVNLLCRISITKLSLFQKALKMQSSRIYWALHLQLEPQYPRCLHPLSLMELGAEHHSPSVWPLITVVITARCPFRSNVIFSHVTSLVSWTSLAYNNKVVFTSRQYCENPSPLW